MTYSPAIPAPPQDGKGVYWRALEISDNEALANLIKRIEIFENPQYRTSAEETLELFSIPSFNAIGGFDTQGNMRVFGMVRMSASDHHQVACDGGTDPEIRGQGFGRRALDWQLEAARSLLIGAEDEGTRPHAVVQVDQSGHEVITHLEELGFVWERSFVELRVDLTQTPPAENAPEFIEYCTWNDALEDEVRQAWNDVTGRSWGKPPDTMEQWLANRSFFAPQWSFIALDRSTDRAQVVGFLLASRYEQDWEVLGHSEGYIDLLGVGATWSEKGIGNQLLRRSMEAMRIDGMDRAATGVAVTDKDSPALELYRSHGFTTQSGSRIYFHNF